MTLIKSHTFTINLANVNYFKSSVDINNHDGTCFYMSNGKCVTITCPYDDVIKQLRGTMNTVNGIDSVKKVVTLDY